MKLIFKIAPAILCFPMALWATDGALRFHLEIPGSPIRFNETVQEYQIVYKGTFGSQEAEITIPLNYCPITGVKLSSGREELFQEPDKKRMHKVFESVRNAENINEIQEILDADPDYIFPDETGTIQYSFEFPTFVLAAYVDSDNEINIRFFQREHETDDSEQ